MKANRAAKITICIILALLAAGCSTAPVAAPTAEPTSTPALSPTPTATPAPTPTPTPSPTPVPAVDADWYRTRNDEIRQWMRLYDASKTESEIDEAVARMYIDPNRPMVALTFDDGPMPGVTDKILDILEEYNVRATFFVLGTRLKDDAHIDLLKRMLALGCEIGNHTYAHHRLTEQSYAEKRSAIQTTNELIFENTGYTVRSLRPPGGYSDSELFRVAESLDMRVVKWSQSGNVHEKDPALIAQNVQKQIVNGKELENMDIILLHDTKERMIDAVALIVPQLLEQGYQLVTAQELLSCSENGYEAGENYRHG